jgi:hypothetical protein
VSIPSIRPSVFEDHCPRSRADCQRYRSRKRPTPRRRSECSSNGSALRWDPIHVSSRPFWDRERADGSVPINTLNRQCSSGLTAIAQVCLVSLSLRRHCLVIKCQAFERSSTFISHSLFLSLPPTTLSPAPMPRYALSHARSHASLRSLPVLARMPRCARQCSR